MAPMKLELVPKDQRVLAEGGLVNASPDKNWMVSDLWLVVNLQNDEDVNPPRLMDETVTAVFADAAAALADGMAVMGEISS